jgi:hypothetical protein
MKLHDHMSRRPPSLRGLTGPHGFVPPRLRFQQFQCPYYSKVSQRSFSSTPQRRFLDPLLGITHDSIQLLHSSTGLPWAASIPLTAILARTVLVPLAIRSRKLEVQQASLIPSLREFAQKTAAPLRARLDLLPRKTPEEKALLDREVRRTGRQLEIATAAETRRVFKENGCSWCFCLALHHFPYG